MSDDSKIGTTLHSNRITTKSIDIDKIIMGTREVDYITLDPTIGDHKALVTAHAFKLGYDSLKQVVDGINPDNIIFQDNSVVTYPIITPFFIDDSEWDYLGFIFDDNKAKLINHETNFLKITSKFFNRIGTYFVTISISELTSGYIEVRDHTNLLLKKIQDTGKVYFEFEVTNPNIQEIMFLCKEVEVDETAIIDSIHVYYATDRIEEYIIYKAAFVASGGEGGFVSENLFNQTVLELQNNIDTINTYLNSNTFLDLLNHILDKNNPHTVKYNQVGAAAENHTHTLAELGAAAIVHTHTPDEVGAADKNHTHTPISLGAADRAHTHDEFIFLESGITESLSIVVEIMEFMDDQLTEEEKEDYESESSDPGIEKIYPITFSEAIERFTTKIISDYEPFKAKISVVKHPTLDEYIVIDKTDNITNWSIEDGEKIVIHCPAISMNSTIIGTPIFNSGDDISSIVVGEDFSQRTVGKCEILIKVASGANVVIY